MPARLHDLTQKRFGRLTVLRRADDKAYGVAWLCRCDCGKELDVAAGALRTGNTKTCGCSRGGGRAPLSERIERNSIPEPMSGCWLWLGGIGVSGYGTICLGSRKDGTRRMIGAHRASYETFVGQIPEGLLVCHRCDNPACVNPDHLFVGTHSDNVQDMMRKGRGRKKAVPCATHAEQHEPQRAA